MSKIRTPAAAQATDADRAADAAADRLQDEARAREDRVQESRLNARQVVSDEGKKTGINSVERAQIIEALYKGVEIQGVDPKTGTVTITRKFMDWPAAVALVAPHIQQSALEGNRAEIMKVAERFYVTHRAQLDHDEAALREAEKLGKLAQIRRAGPTRTGPNTNELNAIRRLMKRGVPWDDARRAILFGQFEPSVLEGWKRTLEAELEGKE